MKILTFYKKYKILLRIWDFVSIYENIWDGWDSRTGKCLPDDRGFDVKNCVLGFLLIRSQEKFSKLIEVLVKPAFLQAELDI
jgi:hypothetical protein